MLQALVIAALVSMHASASGSWRAPVEGAWWVVLGAAIGPVLCGWVGLHAACVWAGVLMDRRGRAEAGLAAARAAGWFRAMACVWLGGSALGFGWSGAVGEAAGISLAGTGLGALWLAGFLWLSWWSQGGIERRMRESLLLRHLDDGRPIWEIASPGALATARLRDGVLMVLVPVLVMIAMSGLLGWLGEGVLAAARRGEAWASWLPAWLVGEDAAVGLSGALQVAGFVAALALMPMLQRRIWDTVVLGDGPLRSRIERMCGLGGVRVREVLVWRTGGMSVNAAVLGVFPRFRYMIFTDALLEWMEGEEVGAVAAHEIGHLRHHHVAWLIAGVGAILTLSAEGGALAIDAAGWGSAWQDAGAVAGVALLGLPLIGVVSRRFEWQADAFAAKLVSRSMGTPGVILHEACVVVGRALGKAASLSGADPRSRSWRHGSIQERQRRVGRLGGLAEAGLGVDRAARAIKVLIVAGWAWIAWLAWAGG